MRKGFILTLTALVSAFMVTSVMAMGPTINGVPDVYISSQGETYPFVNMFRYTDALTLWDYVTPGVVSGDGSSSDTLYWAWAAKDVSVSGNTVSPTGSYLDSASINYSIIQENGIEALLVQPSVDATDPAIGAEINSDLSGTGSNLPDYSLASAGQLTFRNIRLSPTPDQASYPAPVATSGLPAGYYDLQQATLFVSDTTTTDIGTQSIYLATIDNTVGSGNDFLSGGLKWNLEDDLSNSAGSFGSFSIAGTVDASWVGPVNVSQVVFSQTTTDLNITSQLDNGQLNGAQDAWFFGQWQMTSGNPAVDPANIYRMQVALTSTCASGANPHIYIGFNGRTTTGFGYTQIQAGAALGPTATVSKWAGYLVPVESGTGALPEFAVFDPPSGGPYGGGVVTANSVKLESLPLADVLASATSLGGSDASFNAGTTTSDWVYAEFPFGGTGITMPTFTHTPTGTVPGATSLVITATTDASGTQQGLASWQGPYPEWTTLTPGDLAICRVTLSSTAGAAMPSLRLDVNCPTQLDQLWFDHDAGGPTTTPSDYYVVFEPTENTAEFILRMIPSAASRNGNVTMTKVEMLQAPMPFDP